MTCEFIESDAALREFCQTAARQGRLAIDTEFVWTSTYYPQLGLVQLSWDQGHSALVDALAISDPSPLREAIADPSMVKILHEAASDLPILRRWCGALPTRVFDTRIAAGFCGLTTAVSLSGLLESQLGVALAKTETRTDWLQRPLSPAQLQYAAEDVAWLPLLHEALHEKIEKLGNLDWFKEEMSACEQEDYYAEPEPRESWRRVSGMGSLSGAALAVLRELAAWRESTARSLNKARPRLLRDEQLIYAAQHQPKTLNDCRNIPNLWPRSVEKYGQDIVEAVRRGLETPPPEWPSLGNMPVDKRTLKTQADRILNLVRKKAAAREIDPTLVAARREIEGLVLAVFRSRTRPERKALLNGWRYELLKPQIDMILEEMAAVRQAGA
ncbi:MAG: ribonuclease D [Lentisphaerae bacterium]|nr:ribonuclease D [Lentisphaerota bacterium]OQC13265.1 MAG: Ribonuclease D [Lentisphaerae bacterium ADurb.Bin082]HQL86180.1 ribonuclease D [Lentisphaeria bacterium]